MALSPEATDPFDQSFFRFIGIVMVLATLMAGTATLSLTVKEGRSLRLGREGTKSDSAQILATTEIGTVQPGLKEDNSGKVESRR